MKKEIEKTIKERKAKFMLIKKEQLTAEVANRSFFRLVKAFSTPEKPQTFDVRSLCPGQSDKEVAETLAGFFNRISAEFDPLKQEEISATYGRNIPLLASHEVAGRVRRFRKPKSMVAGDVFPDLMTMNADFFAIPLTSIYNEILSTFQWPLDWKTEYVTVIPKTGTPQSFSDLQNISCTKLVSKIMESYVLEWAGQEVACKYNQFGGVKGCSGTQMLIDVWQRLLTSLEDRRAGVVLTSIYYAKAFNRLSFQHCLRAFAKQGASTPILKLIAAFLSDRTMSVRVSSTWSTPRAVTGGCPQGSILGVLLFNLITDDLEDGSLYVELVDRLVVGLDEEEEEDYDTAPPDGQAWGGDSTWGSEQGRRQAVGLVEEDGEDSDIARPDTRTWGGDDDWGGSEHELADSSCPPDWGASDELTSTPPGQAVELRFSPSPVTAGDPVLDRSDLNPRRGQARIVYSSEEDVTPPPEPTKTCLGKWKSGLVAVNKHVDDNLEEEGVNFENAEQIGDHKYKHAVATQNVFRHIIRNAEKRA